MRAFIHKSVRLPQYIPQPVKDWVLTQNIQPKEIVTPSGIALPQDEVREDLAAVIAVGEGYPHHSGPIPLPVMPGDIVRTTRKKGRTAYLDCLGDDGTGGSQVAYNYYQIGEIIAVEYHSQKLAKDIEDIRKSSPAVVTIKEEKEYDKAEAEKLKAAQEEQEYKQQLKAKII